jgi:hypothetical protein
MKRAALVLCAFAAVSAFAEEKPDYSREGLRRTFSAHVIELGPKPKPRFQFKFGAIEFRALGMDWRISYLPVAPLSGTRMGVTQTPPDPFELTGVSIARAPAEEEIQMTAELRAELRRIKRITR